MTIQKSTAVRAAEADAIETAIGTAPTLEFRSGAPPANPAAADSGTLLASGVLPSDWLTNPGTGQKLLNGTWTATGAAGAGTGTAAGHFRIKQGATCHMQGTVTGTGGGGDMTLDNVSIANGQTVSITTFTLTIGNA